MSRARWSLAVATMGGLLLASLASPTRSAAQRVFLYSEPTICSTPFRPISGVTFHAGGGFVVVWYLPSPTFGPIDYVGEPNPAISDDGTKKWSGPRANVTCFIDWYQMVPTPQRDAYYRWHINYYGGTVTSCGGREEHRDAVLYHEEYDPYDYGGSYQPGAGDACSESGGGGGGGGGDFNGSGGDGDSAIPVFPNSGGGGGRSMCPDNQPFYWDIDCIDIYIEGQGWVEYWCGAVMVCG